MKGQISASMMCADLLNMERDIRLMVKHHVELLHCDVMDRHFVPNLMMFPDMINRIAEVTQTPLDVHLMVEDPASILPSLKLREGDYVSLHAESTVHLQRALAAIRARGWKPALALNPATPLCMIEELLPDFDMLLLMTVNPGYSGQKLIPQCLDKITRARKLLDDGGYAATPIEVDGNCSLENTPKMMAAGAEIIVAGSSSVFDKRLGVEEGVKALRRSMGQA